MNCGLTAVVAVIGSVACLASDASADSYRSSNDACVGSCSKQHSENPLHESKPTNSGYRPDNPPHSSNSINLLPGVVYPDNAHVDPKADHGFQNHSATGYGPENSRHNLTPITSLFSPVYQPNDRPDPKPHYGIEDHSAGEYRPNNPLHSLAPTNFFFPGGYNDGPDHKRYEIEHHQDHRYGGLNNKDSYHFDDDERHSRHHDHYKDDDRDHHYCPVPGPLAGTGLPGIVAGFGCALLILLGRLRKRALAA